MNKEMIVLEKAAADDVEGIVNLHLDTIHAGLSVLGHEVLRLFYINAITLKDVIVIVAKTKQSKQVKGWFVLNLANRSIFRLLLLRSPIQIVKLLLLGNSITLFKLFINNSLSMAEKSEEGAELTYIGVAEDWQGRGVGTQLLIRLEEILNENGLSNYYLEVEADNNKALRFYQKNGFIIDSKFVRHGQSRFRMSASVNRGQL